MTNALTYFTGIPCPKGHIAERYLANSVCLECKKLQYIPNGRKGGSPKHPNRLDAIEKGNTIFFTGEPCKHGHIANRETKSGICLDCRKTTYKVEKKEARNYRIFSKYKISEQQYDNMLWKQGGKCAICKQPEILLVNKKPKPLSIDHCHTTGKIRGLLCSTCNTGLGFFKNNPEYLKNAALYCEEG